METKEQTNEIIELVKSSGLETQTGTNLKEKFLPFFDQAEEWKRKAESLVVTDVSQIHEMKIAREARFALRDIRVEANKVRIKLKEDSLKFGKVVQGIYNVIECLISPIEKHLHEQEKFVEIQEEKRKSELKAVREIELEPYGEFVPFGIDLENMVKEDYNKLLNGAKLQQKAKIEAEKKAEKERIAKEKAEAEEKERVRVENARLKKEAEAKEKQLAEERAKAEVERKAIEDRARKEREEAEAKLKAEREAKIKLEGELKAKAEAERKAIEESRAKEEAKKESERKALAAPDKKKLMEFAKTIDRLPLPELKSKEAQKILSDAKLLIAKLSNFIREKSSTI